MIIDSLDTVNLATEPTGDSGGASPHNQDYLFYYLVFVISIGVE